MRPFAVGGTFTTGTQCLDASSLKKAIVISCLYALCPYSKAAVFTYLTTLPIQVQSKHITSNISMMCAILLQHNFSIIMI